MDSGEQAKSGHRERLRERFLDGDASSRTDEALLELLLTFGISRRDVQPLAKALIARFGGLDGVLAADKSALCGVDGVESHVTTLLKLVDYLRQMQTTTRLASAPEAQDVRLQVPTQLQPDQPKLGSMVTIPLSQSEMSLALPGQSELPLAQKSEAGRERKTIQDVLIPEGLLALKVAHESKSLEELHDILVKRLGQNSMETRRRYAQSVVRWFFPDGLSGLLVFGAMWR